MTNVARTGSSVYDPVGNSPTSSVRQETTVTTLSPSSHGVHSGRNPRINPSTTAAYTNTAASAAAVCRPIAATPPPTTAAKEATAAIRNDVSTTSRHTSGSMPIVEPRVAAARAIPPVTTAIHARTIANTPTPMTSNLEANQRHLLGSQEKIVPIVPVCHETATTDAPTMRPRMVVIDATPSRMPGRSTSARCDGT